MMTRLQLLEKMLYSAIKYGMPEALYLSYLYDTIVFKASHINSVGDELRYFVIFTVEWRNKCRKENDEIGLEWAEHNLALLSTLV